MTLEQIYYLSQSLASIAVICSLIYLGLQVRHAERSQRGIMQQGRADRTCQTLMALANPQLALVWQKGLCGDANLSRDEFIQWMLLCRASFLSGEDSFMQHEAGLLADSAFVSYGAGIRFYLSNPGMRVAWQLTRGHFGNAFRGFVDSILRDTTAVHGQDAYAEWKKLVQTISSGPAG